MRDATNDMRSETPFVADPAIAQMVVDIDVPPRGAGATLELAYTIRAPGNPEILALHHSTLDIDRVTCAIAHRVTRDGTSDSAVTRILRRPNTTFDGAAVAIRGRWSDGSRADKNGSPVCVLPSALPQLATVNGPWYPPVPFSDPLNGVDSPRLLLSGVVDGASGAVVDQTGRVLMSAIPMEDQLRQHIVYAEPTLVLGGSLVAQLPALEMRGMRDELLQILQFFGEEFGRPGCVRALVVCEHGAFDYRRDVGEFGVLDERLILPTDVGRLIGERLAARDFAGMWWQWGVRPAGEHGLAMIGALSFYGVIRWFEASGAEERLENELAFLRRVIATSEDQGIHTKPLPWRAAKTALLLYEASRSGPGLRDELRRWCANEWGQTLPMPTVVNRLARIGIAMPN